MPVSAGATMEPKRKIIYLVLLALVWLVVALLVIAPPIAASKAEVEGEDVTPSPEEIALQERREVWLNALEWCESRGIHSAVNKVDRDGTPSYGPFQFKPSTFAHYVEKYAIAVPEGEDFMHYESQRAIVARMIDDPEVNFANEFPDCVRNKIGPPPK